MTTPRSWALIGSGLLLALLLAAGEALVVPAVSEAASAPCRVRNLTQATSGRSLISMVRRTRDGDKLIVRGTCPGTVTISTDILIVGAGLRPTLTGRGKTRVVEVRPEATVALKRLRIQHGRAGSGGGIGNHGRLTMRSVIVRKNVSQAGGGGGGGIWNKRRLTIVDSDIRANVARLGGGAIWNEGKTRLTGSTVRGNMAKYGGGLRTTGISGTTTIIDSTVSGNSAKQIGGGILGGTTTLIDSTVSGNVANLVGGIGATSLTLIRSTVSGNEATSVVGLFGPSGGVATGGTASLTDSLVADNLGIGIQVPSGITTVTRSTVSGNEGGGILVMAGTTTRAPVHGELVLIDSTVTGNAPWGIFAQRLVGIADPVTLTGSSSVHDNTPDDCVGTTAC